MLILFGKFFEQNFELFLSHNFAVYQFAPLRGCYYYLNNCFTLTGSRNCYCGHITILGEILYYPFHVEFSLI